MSHHSLTQNIDIELAALMPLIGRITCYVRDQTSQIYKTLGYDLTPEATDALMIIHHFNGLSQKMLVDILGKDKASITRLLNTLVKSKLVVRVQDEEDRRIVRAHITEEGQQAFLAIYPELQKLSARILEATSPEDFKATIAVLSNIVGAMPCSTPTKTK